MPLHVTPLLILSLMPLFFFLIFKVIRYRRKNKISLSTNKDTQIQVRVRAYGNFIELTPLFCFLILINELCDANLVITSIIAVIFVIGRHMHAFALHKGVPKLRFYGMILSLMPIMIGTINLAIAQVL